jgi:hypothetical protein
MQNFALIETKRIYSVEVRAKNPEYYLSKAEKPGKAHSVESETVYV